VALTVHRSLSVSILIGCPGGFGFHLGLEFFKGTPAGHQADDFFRRFLAPPGLKERSAGR
jgi:hypothetical protein